MTNQLDDQDARILDEIDQHILECSNKKKWRTYSVEIANTRIVSLRLINLNFGGKIPECIGNLPYLKFLAITNLGYKHKIWHIPKNIWNLTNLEILDLSYNELRDIPENIGNLRKLKRLTVSNNDILSLPDSIGNLEKLEELSISKNSLRSLPESIGNLHNLKILDIWHNRVRDLPESCKNLYNLETINLETNDIRVLPEYLTRLPKMKKVLTSQNYNIDGNSVKFILNGIEQNSVDFQSEAIEEEEEEEGEKKLNYHGTPLLKHEHDVLLALEEIVGEEIPSLDKFKDDTFGFVVKENHVVQLGLFEKDLNSLPESIGNLTSLEELSLDYIDITEIKGLEKLTNLKELNLSKNAITEIKGLEKLTNLKELNLSKNAITEIKGLDTLVNLESLNLSENKIQQIEGLEDLQNLKEIDLSRNFISRIQLDILKLNNYLKDYLNNSEYKNFKLNYRKKLKLPKKKEDSLKMPKRQNLCNESLELPKSIYLQFAFTMASENIPLATCTPDGKYIILFNDGIVFWDLSNMEIIESFEGEINDFKWNSTKTRLFLWDSYDDIIIIDFIKNEITSFKHKWEISELSLLKNDTKIAYMPFESGLDIIVVFDYKTTEEKYYTIPDDIFYDILGISFNKILLCGESPSLLCELTSNKIIFIKKFPDIDRDTINPQNSLFISKKEDKNFELWDLIQGKPIKVFEKYNSDEDWEFQWSPDGDKIAWFNTYDSNNEIDIFDIKSGEFSSISLPNSNSDDEISKIIWHPNSDWIACIFNASPEKIVLCQISDPTNFILFEDIESDEPDECQYLFHSKLPLFLSISEKGVILGWNYLKKNHDSSQKKTKLPHIYKNVAGNISDDRRCEICGGLGYDYITDDEYDGFLDVCGEGYHFCNMCWNDKFENGISDICDSCEQKQRNRCIEWDYD